MTPRAAMRVVSAEQSHRSETEFLRRRLALAIEAQDWTTATRLRHALDRTMNGALAQCCPDADGIPRSAC